MYKFVKLLKKKISYLKYNYLLKFILQNIQHCVQFLPIIMKTKTHFLANYISRHDQESKISQELYSRNFKKLYVDSQNDNNTMHPTKEL